MSELAVRTPMQEVVATIEHPEFVAQIKASLPENVTPERFIQIAITAVRSDPELITKDQNTLFASIVRCAQDGLYPDGREAAFVSFGSKVAYMPMIGGFRKIAAEHGWAIDTQVVYLADHFEYELGVNPKLVHEPCGLAEEPGEMTGAYAVATHADGRKIVEVMRKADILKVREVSKSKGSGPWRDWPERMWEKTVGRRIFGKLPLSGTLMERAVSVMAAHDHEYVLPAASTPRLSLDEANIAAPLTGSRVPEDDGPDDTLAEFEVIEPEGEQTSFAPPLASGPQKKKLDVLVGQLRGAGHLTTQQLYKSLARDEVPGEDGELHWSPLRDSLTTVEASDLIEKLGRYAASKEEGPS